MVFRDAMTIRKSDIIFVKFIKLRLLYTQIFVRENFLYMRELYWGNITSHKK